VRYRIVQAGGIALRFKQLGLDGKQLNDGMKHVGLPVGMDLARSRGGAGNACGNMNAAKSPANLAAGRSYENQLRGTCGAATYPKAAEQAGHEGVALLVLTTSNQGVVTGADVLRSSKSAILDTERRFIAAQCRFVPAFTASPSTTR